MTGKDFLVCALTALSVPYCQAAWISVAGFVCLSAASSPISPRLIFMKLGM